MSTTFTLTMRRPGIQDAAAIHELVCRCPPLDVNSGYLYLMLCFHHADTCVVAETNEGEIVGFVSGYRLPRQMETLFVWQVAVDEWARGQGLALRMVEELVDRADACSGVTDLETTISPGNIASRRVFERFAERRGAEMDRPTRFTGAMLGEGEHEDEILFRIGPFSRISREA